MNYFSTLTFSLLTLISFGQAREITMSSNSTKEIVYYLDGVPVDLNHIFFDADKIISIRVMKEQDSTKNGQSQIFIVLKNPQSFNFIALPEIERRYSSSSPSATLFLINHEILKDDIGLYKIDSSYILNVNQLRSCDISSLQSGFPSLTILTIETKTKENLDKASRIHLRGSNTTAIN